MSATGGSGMTADGFRRLALAFAGAIESTHMRHPDFRIGSRVFATLGYPDDAWAMVKLSSEQQQMVVAAEPDIFTPAKGGWGRHGSTLLRLDRADAATAQSALAMAVSNLGGRSGT
jgi:hypothetical protein